MYEVSGPVGMDGTTRRQTDKGPDGKKVALLARRPPDAGYEACQARNMLFNGVGCRPVQDSTRHPATHPKVVFCLPCGNSHQLLSTILDVGQPTPSHASVARGNSQENKICSHRNVPSQEQPFWSSFLHQ